VTPAEYEQLVEFLERQFTEIDRRFTEVNHRFDRVDGEIVELRSEVVGLRGEMLGHFDEIYRRLERLEREYHAITQALRRIEAHLSDESGRREILARDLATLKEQVAALQSRVEDIEHRLRG
jgi:chromosome segregation ATPase